MQKKENETRIFICHDQYSMHLHITPLISVFRLIICSHLPDFSREISLKVLLNCSLNCFRNCIHYTLLGLINIQYFITCTKK